MSDIHQLPLLGHDLPLAADLRRQVRSKARVRKVAGYWSWRHDCGHQWTSATCLPSQAFAFGDAWRHVRKCR